jgi:phosphatidylglycerol:prolipoprotein diacylglycerol transferase
MHYVDTLDPIAFTIGPLAIHWYALAYMAGLFIGQAILNREWRRIGITVGTDNLLIYATLGIILGGRLGEVLFYRPAYYFADPIQILMIWKPGMASHGGMLGLLVAAILFSRRYGVGLATLLDGMALAAPPGLFLGRLANFVNSEMVGKVSDLPWAVIFPVHDLLPRHPSQLYQAVTEGPLVFLAVWLFPARTFRPGARAAVFMIVYGLLRTLTEFSRERDPGYLGDIGGLTNGQALSLLLALAGAVWLFLCRPVTVPSRSSSGSADTP